MRETVERGMWREPDPNTLPEPVFTIDRVTFVSEATCADLRQHFQLDDLKRLGGKPDVRPPTNPAKRGVSWVRSTLDVTLAEAGELWDLVEDGEERTEAAGLLIKLSKVEVAFDFLGADEAEVCRHRDTLIQSLYRPWHQRREMGFIYKPWVTPPAGIIQGPTYYFEHGGSRTAQLIYCRYAKAAPDAPKQRPRCRVEIVMNNSGAVGDKLAVEWSKELRNVDGRAFRDKHLQFRRIDYDYLGGIAGPRWVADQSERASFFLRSQVFAAACETAKRVGYAGLSRSQYYDNDDTDELLRVARLMWRSPAHVIGYFRRRKRALQKRRGPLTRYQRMILDLTDYKLTQRLCPKVEVWWQDKDRVAKRR